MLSEKLSVVSIVMPQSFLLILFPRFFTRIAHALVSFLIFVTVTNVYNLIFLEIRKKGK